METTTAAKCHTCIDLLTVARSNLAYQGPPQSRTIADKTFDQLERLKLWVGNTYALHTPDSPLSLDIRLNRAPDVLEHVMHILEDVHEVASDRRYTSKISVNRRMGTLIYAFSEESRR